jgi:predicted  nucleic acid-binding Zn-ribbon protein
MTFKTIAEQEREAYITGHTQMAKMLGHAIDGEVNQTEHENELDSVQEDLEAARSEIEELREEIDALKAQIAQLEDELRIAREGQS